MVEDTVQAGQVHLNHIGQIALTVSDLVRGKAFYNDVLGMTLLFDAGSMVFFQCGDVRLMIGTGESPGGGTILYFKVAEIQTVFAALKSKDVEFIQEPHLVARMADHDLWLAIFKDPDGNVLALMSEVPRA
jgi:methylmalonyl-CoA/ethylmalonyl-CoA epimerase